MPLYGYEINILIGFGTSPHSKTSLHQHWWIQQTILGVKEGPNLPQFSSFSMDLGYFILKLLNFDINFFILS